MENKLISVVDNQIIVAQEVKEKLKQFYEMKARMAVMEDELKSDVLQAMEKYGIKKVDNEVFSITYKAPSEQKRLDTEALKLQGLYDCFLKKVKIKSSVMIKFK